MMSYDLTDYLLTAPTPFEHHNPPALREQLPLNLVAHILTYFSDVGDLARLCRTSRLLNFLTTPLLYRCMRLTVFEDREELRGQIPDDGSWHASSFAMGLDALVARKRSALVEELHLDGTWSVDGGEDRSREYRLPDASLMLNIAVRAAIQNCSNLKFFRWTLNVRPMLTLYGGLAALPQLESLHVQLSSTGTAQPQIVIPPMPNLRELYFMDYDPTSYPDNLSILIYNASNLRTLKIHFPRKLRKNSESVVLGSLFERNIAMHRVLPLRCLGLYNIATTFEPEISDVISPHVLEELTVINSYSQARSGGKTQATHIVDASWTSREGEQDRSKIRVLRTDKINHLVIKELESMHAIEKLYLVDPITRPYGRFGLVSPTPSPTSSSGAPSLIGPPMEVKATPMRLTANPTDILRDNLISTISSAYGFRLRHLILPTRLPVTTYNISRLAASCPNMTQLSFAMEDINPEVLRNVGPSARHLRCCRIMAPNGPGSTGKEQRDKWDAFEAREDHGHYFGLELSGAWGNNPLDLLELRYIGLGDKVWETSSLQQEAKLIVDENGDEIETTVFHRTVKPLTLTAVADIEIWKYNMNQEIL